MWGEWIIHCPPLSTADQLTPSTPLEDGTSFCDQHECKEFAFRRLRVSATQLATLSVPIVDLN